MRNYPATPEPLRCALVAPGGGTRWLGGVTACRVRRTVEQGSRRLTRTPAVKGIPRSRWLKALGVHDQLVVWLKPQTCPSWLTREALAALPDSLVRREVRYDVGTPGFRTRQITLVSTTAGDARRGLPLHRSSSHIISL
jgi:hypothetical protein